jgi:hypothetical protein
MASITQQVGNYKSGISELPDELKVPGQVVDLKNAIPDITRGCIKRPGSDLVAAISPSTAGTGGKWFPIYTEQDEQYIGQVATDGVVNIWRCSDGALIPVDYANVAGTNLATYLVHTNPEDIQPLTVNQTTFFANRTKTVAMKTDSANKTSALVNEAFISLRTITYGKQYSLDIFDPTNHSTVTYNRATAIEAEEDVDTSGISGYSNDGKCEGMSKHTVGPTSTDTGPSIHSTSPPATTDSGTYARSGTTVTVTKTGHGFVNGEKITLDFTSGTATDGTYTIQSVADANTLTITDTASGTTSGNVTITRGKSNLRYEMDVRCTPIPQEGSTNNAYDDSYQPHPTLQFGGEGWSTNDTHTYTSNKGLETQIKITAHVAITARANVALVRPEPTASNAVENVSAESILAGIKNAIDSMSGHGLTVTVAGNGLHLHRDTPFNVTTTETNLMNIITSTANSAEDLPKTCRHGYIVQVVNSGEDQDDYYLKFKVNNIADDNSVSATYARSGTTITVTSNSHGLSNGDTIIADFTSGAGTDGFYTVANVATNTFEVTDSASGTISSGTAMIYTPNRYGEGVWEECPAPNLDIKFDVDTMPLQLKRVLPGTFSINGGGATSYANGAFRFEYPPWDDRAVGDDLTNPKPSFVDNQINKIFFFRNRIGLLSGENVILSRVNDFYNFWAKTAFTIANADPIDLQSTSTYPTDLFDAIEVNAGLLMFSASQQFLLKTDEAQLTPETAIVSYLSSYAFNEKTKPFNMGTTAGWLNSTAKRTRFHEMAGIQRNGEPQVLEQTKIISKLFPDDITLVAESTENSMVLFGSKDKNEVWGYKYYTQGEQRIQSAWFRWELPGTVTFHCTMDDVYYAILKNGSTYTLQSFDIKKATDTLMVGTAPTEYLIHLDTKKEISSGSLTYNATTNKTSMTKPTGYDNSGQLAVFCKTAGNNVGRFSKATVNGGNIEWEGDWSSLDIILGYLYEFEVELPTIYVTQSTGEQIRSETRGSLIVHRLNFSFGSVGLIDVTLKRKGRPDYNKTYESIEWDSYLANTLGVADEYIHTIPVYERNTNLSVHLNSTHPSPAIVNSMTWEGDYNPKFYQRV